ncbi:MULTISPECIES: iron ABC transporter permease [Rhodopseudomonas]|uniref:Iron ABC transporter permease n=1 Tax=Rhodopseudomonas palustris TaxID=1076 RepID=A0A0D7EW40_RHOPL|nr:MULTISPECIES: iron ABC transporter permease [Rhodopseudomonas]KIZ45074.1 iron ABC transporter permease [Rhodopseudomonas palustris]MDF3812341.1 iron ABC transporter permease [Rhodopseudomonas sp. BAL398]WOK15344.1 iron ABC transporter permease [Rhodopseudomonas sp. BAL398]
MKHFSRIERSAAAIALLTALAVAAPVVSIAVVALGPVDDLWPHLLAYVLPQALRDTALLLLGVGTVALSIGAGSAWLMSSRDFPGRALLLWLMPLPLAIPTYLAAYVYVDLFEPLGLAHRMLTLALPPRDALGWLPNLRSLPGAILVIGLVLYPYVYLSARAMFQVQSAEFAEAAKVLGAGRFTIFRRVTLPMARPALAVGVSLVSLETLNDIGASEYLGVRTLTLSIFTTWLNRGSLAGAAQLSLVLLAIVAALIALERNGRRNASVESSAENPRLTPRTNLPGLRGWLAFAACLTPPLLGFLLPVAYLLRETLRRDLVSDGAVWRDAWHSVTLAAAATAIALLLGLIVVLALRWRPTRLTRIAAATAQAGYALPGLVLALGLLAPVLLIDGGFAALAHALGLPPPGLLMIGSGAALVAAYVIRFLAVPSGFIAAGFARIPRDYDDSASAAGASRLTALRRVDLPLLRPALLGAAIVVFVDCLKELPATLLLRPLNVETLATSIYQYASRGSFEDGALAALLIVAASVPPVIWLTRFADVPQGPA